MVVGEPPSILSDGGGVPITLGRLVPAIKLGSPKPITDVRPGALSESEELSLGETRNEFRKVITCKKK